MKKFIFAALAALVPVALIIWVGYNSEFYTGIAAGLTLILSVYKAREEEPVGAFLLSGLLAASVAVFYVVLCMCVRNSMEDIPLLCGSVMYAALFWKIDLYTCRHNISKKKYVVSAAIFGLLFDIAFLGLLFTACSTSWFCLGMGFLIGNYMCRAIKTLKK